MDAYAKNMTLTESLLEPSNLDGHPNLPLVLIPRGSRPSPQKGVFICSLPAFSPARSLSSLACALFPLSCADITVRHRHKRSPLATPQRGLVPAGADSYPVRTRLNGSGCGELLPDAPCRSRGLLSALPGLLPDEACGSGLLPVEVDSSLAQTRPSGSPCDGLLPGAPWTAP